MAANEKIEEVLELFDKNDLLNCSFMVDTLIKGEYSEEDNELFVKMLHRCDYKIGSN